MRRYRNVERVTADLSGAGPMILGSAREPTDTVGALCSGLEPDLVVSANLLSQLPILPIDWFDARGLPGPPDLGRRIIERHLDALARLPARICLVTDILEQEEDRSGAGHGPDRSDARYRPARGRSGLGLGACALRGGGAPPPPRASRRRFPRLVVVLEAGFALSYRHPRKKPLSNPRAADVVRKEPLSDPTRRRTRCRRHCPRAHPRRPRRLRSAAAGDGAASEPRGVPPRRTAPPPPRGRQRR